MLQGMPTIQSGVLESAGTATFSGQRLTPPERFGFFNGYSPSEMVEILNIVSKDLFDSACSPGITSNDTPPQYHRDYYRDLKQGNTPPLSDMRLDAYKRFFALWTDYKERAWAYPDQKWLAGKTYFSIIPQAQIEAGELADFQQAQEYFLQNKEEIVRDYNNKYVAILGNEIVDSDEDFSSLAKRVYAKFGYRAIYMPRVTREEEVIRIPSPHLQKHLES